MFLTRGKGYYEQYKAGQSLAAYGLPAYFNGTDSLYETDLIRRLWLDNFFTVPFFPCNTSMTKQPLFSGEAGTGMMETTTEG